MTIDIATFWREEALDDALRAAAEDGNGSDALLRRIRQNCPAGSTMLLWADRRQLLRYFEQQGCELRSLRPGNDLFFEDERVQFYTGWYAVNWREASLEFVLVPDNGTYGTTILIADDEAVLRALVADMDQFLERPVGRALRYSFYWESATDLDRELGKVTWDDLVLPERMMDDIRTAVEGFAQHRQAFTMLGFPWRRGILLIGPPGTGKTMVCKAAASALPDLPFLYVRDFREERATDAVEAIFARARKLAPCILAFEDIDGLMVEDKRTVFLNELDGFQNNEGLLIIASSNHPERIDEALLKRPSRFDRVFHLGLPGPLERERFCLRVLTRSEMTAILAPSFDGASLARQVAERTDGFTPAYLKEVFISAALQRAQSGAMILDHDFAVAVMEQVEALRLYLRQIRDPQALAEMKNEGTALGFRS